MALHFTKASSELLDVGGAGLNFTGSTTIAAIIRKTADAANQAVFSQHTGTTKNRMTIDTSNKISFQADANILASPTITVTVADGWVLAAVTKATGTTNPRYHKYLYSSNTWTHENSGSTMADATAPGTTNCRIGASPASTLPYDGDMQIVGYYNAALSDAQLEAMALTLGAWYQVPPKGLWLLDQQVTTQKVNDLTGQGGNEVTRTGTSISSTSLPVFNYGMPVRSVLRQPAAVGGGASSPRDLLLLGAG